MDFKYDFSNGNSNILYYSDQGQILDEATWYTILQNRNIPFLLPVEMKETGIGYCFSYDLSGVTNMIAWKSEAVPEEARWMDRQLNEALVELRRYQIPETELVLTEKYLYVDDRTGNVRFLCIPLKNQEAAPTKERPRETEKLQPMIPPVPQDDVVFEDFGMESTKKRGFFGRRKAKKKAAGFMEPELPPEYTEKIPLKGAEPRIEQAKELYDHAEPIFERTEEPYKHVEPMLDHMEEPYNRVEPMLESPDPLYNRSVLMYDRTDVAYNRTDAAYESTEAPHNRVTSPLYERERSEWQEEPKEQKSYFTPYSTQENEEDDDGTRLLVNDGDEGTVLLNMSPALTGRLVRVQTQEQFRLNRRTCKVGKKSAVADVWLKNNPAFSREHCIISYTAGAYYLEDCNSTNFTLLEGKRVMPGEPVKLFDNCRIQLADEEFIFYEK